jgi:hypothetical protein
MGLFFPFNYRTNMHKICPEQYALTISIFFFLVGPPRDDLEEAEFACLFGIL